MSTNKGTQVCMKWNGEFQRFCRVFQDEETESGRDSDIASRMPLDGLENYLSTATILYHH